MELGQLLDVLVEGNPPIDGFELVRIGHVRGRVLRMAGLFAPVVRERVRRNLEQPDRYRQAPPFETANRGERLLEHLRRDVFSGCPVPGAATDERIDSVDVPLLNLDKSSRIGLRRLDEEPIVFGRLGQSEPRASILITALRHGKLCRTPPCTNSGGDHRPCSRIATRTWCHVHSRIKCFSAARSRWVALWNKCAPDRVSRQLRGTATR